MMIVMIDIRLLREEPERVKDGIAKKNADPVLVDVFLKLDAEWREVVAALDEKRAEQKKLSSERNIEAAKKNKEDMKALDEKRATLENERAVVWMQIPNLPNDDVPVGVNDEENKTRKKPDEPKKFDFQPKDHVVLGEGLDILDIERAGKVSGSRFSYLKRDAARLEFAIIQFVFEFLADAKNLRSIIKKEKLTVSDAPFIPVIPPVLIKSEAMRGMGYVERGKDQIYHFLEDDLYLVGTAEQSIGPMHGGEIFQETDLPRRYIAFSTSFRREAGSHGKDVRGLIRAHQFDKAEMFSLTLPRLSSDEHLLLLGLEESMMQELEIDYRVLDICTGDLGDPAAAKFDIEAWMPGENEGTGAYRETHSTSNTTDFQSRRLNIRYRNSESGKPEFVHMLNGTAFAVGRILVAILENYQQKDGSVVIPKVLQKYVGKKIITPPDVD